MIFIKILRQDNILKYKRLLLIAVVLVAVFVKVLAAGTRPESIRVAILRGAEEVRVDGDGLLATDESGYPVAVPSALLIRKHSTDTISIGGRPCKRLTISPSSTLRVNGKSYRGLFEFFPAEKGVLVVNEMPIEEYLVGLINCEISSLWPVEAVKAQAVIARSYAIYQKDARRNALYHLESSTLDQVYDGVDIEDSRAVRAVEDTKGEVLAFGSDVIQAFYHSNCGGHTEAAANVWGAEVPYLQGVECRYCLNTPSARWELSLPLKKVESLLKNSGYQVSGLKEVRTGRLNRSGRVVDMSLSTAKGVVTISAVNFRKALGYTVIKSTNFSLRQKGDGLLFSGAGNGHGVGLCQWGAKQRAGDGFNYQEILAYYYPGVRIEKLKQPD
jgi:stage II sporulation protein D